MTRKIETVETPPETLFSAPTRGRTTRKTTASTPKHKEASKIISSPTSIDETTEIWKTVEDFPNYEVSSAGRVKSLNYNSTGKPGLLTLNDDSKGRLYVAFRKDGKIHYKAVSHLVLEAFVEKRSEGKESCHWDDNYKNNNVSNLRWGDRYDNMQDKIRNGRNHQINKTQCPYGHDYNYANTIARKDGSRECKACTRAADRQRRTPRWKAVDFNELADKCYEEVIQEAKKHPKANCHECPLIDRGKHVPTKFPVGKSNGLSAIGESPGTQEKRVGQPFVGPSGKLLDKVFEHHQIQREETLLTNAALCNYADDEKSVLPEAIKCCRPRLLQELKNNNIHTAVTLGNAAAQSLLYTKVGITKLRGGDAKDSDYMPGLKVVPTLHPAYTMRDQGKFPLLLSDVGKVRPREASWIEPNIVVIEDAERALAALNGASTTHPYVLDVETGKEKEAQYSRTTNLLCVGLGSTKPDHNNRVVVIGRPAIHDRRVEDALIKLVSKTGVICQNGKFDCYILHTINHHDLPIYLVADTMLQSYSLNENPGTHGLKYMGVEILGTPEWEDEIKPYLKAPKFPPELRGPALEYVRDALSAGPQLRSMVLSEAPENIDKGAIRAAAVELQVREYKTPDAEFRPHQIRWAIDPESSHPVATPEADGSYASIPPEILHKYNAFDIQVTRLLHKHFIKEQAEDGLTEFNKHLMVMANALMKVERNGLAVDYDFNAKLYDDFTNKLDALRKRLPDDINIGSPIQLKAHIEDAYGYSPESTAEETITGYINDPATTPAFLQFCQDLLEYRRWSKLRSTYVTSIRKQALDNGGKVLPTFKIDQATTGRLASKNPNCYSSDTEILTDSGWKLFSQLVSTDRVAQWHTDERLDFVVPYEIVKQEYTGKMIHIATESTDQLVTPNHRVYSKARRQSTTHIDQASRWLWWTPGTVVDRKFIRGGYNIGRSLDDKEKLELELAVACQADGYVRKDFEAIQIEVRSDRKKNQLCEIWDDIRVHSYDQSYNAWVKYEDVNTWIELPSKNFRIKKLTELSSDDLSWFIDCVMRWDGDSTRKATYLQHPDRIKSVEAVQIAAILSGKSTQWSKYKNHYNVVNVHHKSAIRNCSRVFTTEQDYDDQVYCVVVPTGAVVTRRNNQVVISGNTQNMPRQFDIKRQFIPSRNDRVFVHADYSQLELRVMVWLAQDERLKDLFNDPERDIFDELTLSVYGISEQEFKALKDSNPEQAKEMRVVVKSFCYGILYGRSPQGIADDPKLNITVEQAVERHSVFKKQIPKILKFQDSVIRQIHEGRDLVNVFGRRRRFHLITNQNRHDLEKQAMAYLPQSTASDICVTALSRLPDYFDPRNIVHDDIIIETPRDQAHEQGKLLAKIMCETAEEYTQNYVKFEADYEIGENWQDMVKPHKWTG